MNGLNPVLSGIVMATMSLVAEEVSGMRGEPLPSKAYVAGYNAPASFAIQNSWHIDIGGDFLYYDVGQSGMEIASSASNVLLQNFSYATVVSDNQQLFTQKTHYSPGFKVALGAHSDNWRIYAEYTWIQTHTHSSFSPPSASFGSPVLLTEGWFQSTTQNGTPLAATQIESQWKAWLNIVDLLASRPFYESRHLVIRPYGGIRGAFIYQHLNMDFTQAANTVAFLPPQPIYSHNRSKFWGVGPKFGLEADVLLPQKFRLQGDIAWSLMYSQFHVAHEESASSTNQVPSVIDFSIRKNGNLINNLEMGLGIGWGSYVAEDRYHVDFFAAYDFALFSEQNAMRSVLNSFLLQAIGNSTDLYYHGLNINARIDF